MSTQADIKSIDTLSLVKLAMISYAHESSQALADIEIEGQRGIDWITVDRRRLLESRNETRSRRR